jgi:hypothetical protein
MIEIKSLEQLMGMTNSGPAQIQRIKAGKQWQMAE